MNLSKNIVYLLLFLFICDFSYSTIQYYNLPFDGDVSGGIIIENQDVKETFSDPFGINTLLQNKRHPNPNRYFCHLFFREYFLNTPLVLQNIVDPITSIFLSAAIIKSIIHLGIIYFLGVIILQFKFKLNQNLLILALLIQPMFQVKRFSLHMGIIDRSITYTFFYALPILLLLIYLVCLYNISFKKLNRSSQIGNIIMISLLTIILPFTGPLIAPILLILLLITSVIYLRNKLQKDRQQFSFNIFYFLIPIGMISTYSLILGSYNSTYLQDIPSIWERYLLIVPGFFEIILNSTGFHLLIGLTIFNITLIKKKYNFDLGKRILSVLPWVLLFMFIYLALLPLGGYRPYRPNIIRYDTFIPVTLCLFLFYSASTLHLLKNIQIRKKLYTSTLATMCLFFTFTDLTNLTESDCQRKEMLLMSNSNKQLIKLDEPCEVLSWGLTTEPEHSRRNAELLFHWNITDKVTLYYQDLPKSSN